MNEQIAYQFFEFIIDRQRVYREKEARNPWPWTDDKILQTYKFCNVYRELDKGTQYLLKTLMQTNLTLPNKLFWIIFYRRFNIYGMFETFFGKKFPPRTFNAGWLIWRLDQLKKKNIRLFNDAYTTCQIPFQSATRPHDKHVQIILSMEQIWKKKECEDICKIRFAPNLHTGIQIPSHRIGPFLAYQILQDYAVQGGQVIGIDDFTFVGPGAKPALDWIFGESNKQKPEFLCMTLRDAQDEFYVRIRKDKGKDFYAYALECPDAFPNGQFGAKLCLSIHNIQASLCEFRKYKNLLQGKGRKRFYRNRGVEHELS